MTSRGRPSTWARLVLATLATLCPLRAADEEALETPAEASEQSDDIGANLLRDLDDGTRRLFPFMEDLEKARDRFKENIGLSYGATYHSVGFASLLSDGADTAASGDFTFQGAWAPGHHWTDNPTQLRFRMRYRHAIGDTPASGLGNQIGTLWGVVDGFSDAGFEVPDFYLQHHFERPGILVRYGQLTIDNQFDAHQLRGSKQSFLNQAFSSNPAVAFPRFGAGLTLRKEWDSGIDLTLGGSSVQGTQTGTQVDFNFGSGDLFEAIQLGYDFKRGGLPVRIQVLGWHSDAVEDAMLDSGHGLAATYEQQLREDGLQMFARFAWASGGATPVELFAAAGLGRPCGENDFMGVAVGAGRASGASNDLQGVIEAFYRWQPRRGIRVSPDVQVLFGNGFNDSPGLRVVAGLRAEIAF